MAYVGARSLPVYVGSLPPDDPDIVYIGTFPTGIYKTEDGGATSPGAKRTSASPTMGIFYITFKPGERRDDITAGAY